MNFHISQLKKLGHVCLILTILFLSACTKEESTALKEGEVTFRGAATKGPLSGATISVYAMDVTGNKTGASLAQTTTVNGSWSLTVSNPNNELLLVESSGGEYIDESDPESDVTKKRKISLQAGEVLQGILVPGQTTAAVNFFTYTLVENMRKELVTSVDLIQAFNRVRSRAFNILGFDPFVEIPTDPILPVAASTVTEKSYALLIGGAAYTMNNAAIKTGATQITYPVIDAMIKDFSDCKLDGVINGISVVDLLSFPVGLYDNISINNEIVRFKNNNSDQYVGANLPTWDDVEFCNTTPVLSRVLPSHLIDLSFSTGTVTPNFLYGTSNYNVTVPFEVSSISLMPVADTLSSQITVNTNAVISGQTSTPVNLIVGNNTVDIMILAEDGITETTVTVNVNRNDPPVFSSGSNISVQENTTAIGNVVALDNDGGTVTYSIGGGIDQGFFNIDANTGALTFTTARNFESPNDDGVDNSYLVDIIASDGTNNVTLNMSVTVTDINDEFPVSVDKSITISEDTSYAFSNTDFSFSDLDAGNTLNQIKITSLETAGSLRLSSVDVLLNQVITVSDINAGNLMFSPAANANGSGYDNFTFMVHDGLNYSVAPNTVLIDVTPVADLPTALNNTISTNININYTFLASDFNFNDADGDSFFSMEITMLETVGSLQLSGVDIAINQIISVADINAGNLVFIPVTNASGAAYDSFSFTVNDGVNDSTTVYIMTVDVININSAPDGIDATLAWFEDTGYIFTVADFGFTDVVNGNNFVGVKITTLPGAGALELYAVAVAVNDIIAVVDIPNLTFNSALNANGIAYSSFTFQVQDDGGTANGGVDLDPTPNTITIDVNAVNDAPTGANTTITVTEDVPYVFAATDFGFIDAIDSNILLAVKINALASPGILTVNSVGVTLGDFISIADINAGNFVYTPALNDNGVAYTSFAFQVQDDGGVADGGVDLSTTANSITIDVTAVNDAPTFTSLTTGSGLDNSTSTDYISTALDVDSIVIYSLTGGADKRAFTIDANTGVLGFIVEPDYVNPHDMDLNNNYVVEVTVTDGSLSNMQIVTVTIPNPDANANGYSDLHETAAGVATPVGTTISIANTNNTLTSAVTWGLAGSPYRIVDSLSIDMGGSLTIDAGVVVKFDAGTAFFINGGGLTINGGKTTWSSVQFTSVKDDLYQGDTNGDTNTTAPAAGDWIGIQLVTGSPSVTGLKVLFAGTGIYISEGSPTFANTEVKNSLDYGVEVYSTTTASPVFTDFTSTNVQVFAGVYIWGTGTIDVTFNGKGHIVGNPTGSNLAAVEIYNVANITMDGYLIEGGAGGINAANASTGIISNSIIRNVNHANGGVYLNSTGDYTFKHNAIVNNSNAGFNIFSVGTNTVIKHNIIRGNLEGGIYSTSTNPALVYNNLIVQNSTTAFAGGVAIGGGNITLEGNTIVGNVFMGTGTSAGVAKLVTNHNLTMYNNIIYGNVQNDTGIITGDMDLITDSVYTTGDFNFTSAASGGSLYGANKVMGDPLFTSGWYLGSSSSAIDAGSTTTEPGYLAELATPIAQADGTVDMISADTLDIGYHHKKASDVSAALTQVIFNAGNIIGQAYTDLVTIIPTDSFGDRVGAGLNITFTTSNTDLRFQNLVDKGDGVYEVTVIADVVSSVNVSLNITVNGVGLSTVPSYMW